MAMKLDVQWFIAALVDAELVEKDDAIEFYASFERDAELEEYAQAVLDQLVGDLSEEDAQEMCDRIQTEIEIAVEQAADGESPSLFAAPKPRPGAPKPPASAPPVAPSAFEPVAVGSLGEIFDVEKVMAMGDDELSAFMLGLFETLRSAGVSDLHISAGARPYVRRNLAIEMIGSTVFTPKQAEYVNYALLPLSLREKFETDWDMSFALALGRGKGRCRVALTMQKDGISGCYRLVPSEKPSLAALGFLENDEATIRRLLDYHNGLVLITGPIGSGKTTTLSTLLDILNRARKDHIITVEDPIEVLQESIGCRVTQREIGAHTDSYHTALRAALREDPDVVVIGEMHDLETIEHAIAAAETGHLVIGTLHTGDAGNTLNRLLDVFPAVQQAQIRTMTAGNLRGVVCQRLVPAANGGLTTIYEILVNTTAVGNLISEGKTFQLAAAMQIGLKQGMCTYDTCVLEKYRRDLITYEVAAANLNEQTSHTQLKREQAIKEARRFATEHGGPKA